MSEQPAAPEGEPQETPPAEAPAKGEDVDSLKQYLAKANGEAKDYRLKLRETERELDSIRKSSMSETDKAVAEAEARGRSTAATEFGKRLARTEFDAIAARRNPAVDSASLLEFVDLARFVGEDGEPDSKAIQAAVERLVPAPADGPPPIPSFDGGTRVAATAGPDMNQILRRGLRGG